MNLKPEVRTLVGIHWHGNSRAPRPKPKNPGVRTSRGVDRKAETTPATWAAPSCKAKCQKKELHAFEKALEIRFFRILMLSLVDLLPHMDQPTPPVCKGVAVPQEAACGKAKMNHEVC